MDKSTAIEPSKDSFKAFTETVEALALQKSVIGEFLYFFNLSDFVCT